MSGSSFFRSALIASVLPLVVGTSGCYSRITGQQGNFEIAYASFIQPENFVKPIAPGAKLDLVAFANGTDDELTIVKAISTRPDVLAIDATNRARVVVKGVSVGAAEIEITVKDKAGKTLVDKMFFHVRKPATHKIEHACTENKEAAYVKGDFVDVYHALSTEDKRPFVGYGYAPVKVEPASALTLVAQPQENAVYRFKSKKAGTGKVKSSVDAGELTFQIVERGDLTEASLASPDQILIGQERYAVARVKLGETPLCSQNALTTARSLTPTICDVTGRLDDEAAELGDSNRWQIVTIKAKAFGTCEYEVTLPELAKGKGVVLKGKTQVGRVEYPKEGAAVAQATPSIVRDLASWAGLSKWYVISRLAVLAGLLFWRRKRA